MDRLCRLSHKLDEGVQEAQMVSKSALLCKNEVSDASSDRETWIMMQKLRSGMSLLPKIPCDFRPRP